MVKFLVYLNRHVFVMISRQQKSSPAGKELTTQLTSARQDTFECLVSQLSNVDYMYLFYPEYLDTFLPVVKFEQLHLLSVIVSKYISGKFS